MMFTFTDIINVCKSGIVYAFTLFQRLMTDLHMLNFLVITLLLVLFVSHVVLGTSSIGLSSDRVKHSKKLSSDRSNKNN